MDRLDNIKNTWKKANQKISEDNAVNAEFIKTAVTTNSVGITAALEKSINSGIVLLLLDMFVFAYNIYFYSGNNKILTIILMVLLVSSALLFNLFYQRNRLRNIECRDLSLHEILIEKIRYFNKSFYWVLQTLAISTALLPFAVNLTQENANGEFNISKIYLLVGFYFLVYILSINFFRLLHGIYLKQLKNALKNLKENTMNEMEDELKKSQKIRKIFGIVFFIIAVFGILAYLITLRP